MGVEQLRNHWKHHRLNAARLSGSFGRFLEPDSSTHMVGFLQKIGQEAWGGVKSWEQLATFVRHKKAAPSIQAGRSETMVGGLPRACRLKGTWGFA